MKKVLSLIILLCVSTLRSDAISYYSVNYDRKTVAAMTAAFGTESAAEIYYSEQVQKILDRYSAAEVASAGIFATKYLDRKALTDPGILISKTENYYYRRIYTMVSAKIMPKIWTVAQMMISSPQTAIYWGSYLYKICSETKSLCMQFESVVTNGKLGFSDITFLEFKPSIATLFRLADYGDIDWKTFFNDLGNIGQNITKENLKADLDKLYNLGVGVAGAGAEEVTSKLLSGSNFHGTMTDKISSIVNVVSNTYSFYKAMEDGAFGTNLMKRLGNQVDASRLFSYAAYNMTSWTSDYLNELSGQYYTQRWYIYRSGIAGKVVYEDLYDSYSMNLEAFQKQLQVRLAEYNDNEERYTYYIGSDSKKYYSATDATKLKGAESVIISVTCHDGFKLSEGNTQYKCKKCGSSVNAHTKECSMLTSVTESGIDNSELDRLEKDYAGQVSALQNQIDVLEAQNANLVKQIASATVSEAATLRQQYNANKDKIAELKSELAEVQQMQSDLQKAKSEAAAGEAEQTDDYYRIPAIMNDCKTAFDLNWTDAGSWSGNTFIRTATSGSMTAEVQFKATISISRKPKYFLGIKIHRAIVQIAWELTADYSDTQVVDIIELDQSNSDQTNAKIVNNRISEVAKEYPSCEVTTEYIKSEAPEEDASTDTYHLLWSSDRLEIARQIDVRITQIYADLVSLEKMMHYKRSIIDVLKDVAPTLDDRQGKKLTITEEAYQRWRNSAKYHNSKQRDEQN
jgi:hypothetical protein